MSAVIKLAEALPQTSITSLECAACDSVTVPTITLCSNAHLSCRSVDGHPLPIDQLKGTTPTESIDLSLKGLSVASAIIITECIAGNKHLKQLCFKSFPETNPNVPECSQHVDCQGGVWLGAFPDRLSIL